MINDNYVSDLIAEIDLNVCHPKITSGLINILLSYDIDDGKRHNILRSTYELIAMHLLFEEGKELFFLPRLVERVEGNKKFAEVVKETDARIQATATIQSIDYAFPIMYRGYFGTY